MRIRPRFAVLAVMYASLVYSNPACAQFSQQGPKLVAADGAGAYSVALSADGNTAIVGGPDSGSPGAAWVWTRSGGVWTQQSTRLVGSGAIGNANQGCSVSLSADGNTVIVGGLSDNNFAGAVWIWTRSAGVWTQQGPKLVGSGAVGSARQGASVSLSADGNTAFVGGTSDNSGTGAAWVWTRNGGSWSQEGTKLTGSGAVGNANQGWSVSVSADGNTAIAGGNSDNGGVGAAWVWNRSGGLWTQQTKLVGSGSVGNADQGWSVSVSADGHTAIVGGDRDNHEAGAAWVWIRNGGVWTQQGSKLVGADTTSGANQGSSVSLSGDGNTAIIGAPRDNQVGVGCCEIAIAGAARMWTRSGGVWTQLGTKLTGSDSLRASQGTSVSLSADGTTAIVGGGGAAWVFVPNSIASAIPALSVFASVILLLSIATLAFFRLR